MPAFIYQLALFSNKVLHLLVESRILKAAAKSGMGLLLTTNASASTELEKGTLVPILPKSHHACATIYVSYYHDQLELLSKNKLFLEHLLKNVPEKLY